MSSSMEHEVKIPEIIVDVQNKKKYRRCGFLGKGGFAKCYEIVETKSKDSFAGKIISKTHIIKNKHRDKITQEIHIHKMLKNKNIVSFHSVFEDDYFVYIVLELCRKISMMELHKKRRTITEPETRYFIHQILEGTLYLHQQSIIHRDLKLGNIFLSDGMEVKIGDLGLATRIEYKGQKKNTLCGTPNYIAPEILNKTGHSFEVDVWSIGCIMFTLLVGKPPFESSSLKETYARIIRCDYNIPSHLNKSARTIINRMLQSDPKKRPSVSEIMRADFFTNGYMPRNLPTLCLTMAPQFDSINYRESLFNRMPLVECNSPKPTDSNSFVKPQNLVMKPTMINVLKTKFKMSPVKNEECLKNNKTNMISLGKELKNILMCKPCVKGVQHLEEYTDPAVQSFIWVSKWIDYSDKYGFGYELSDGCVSVIFNDFTQIILLANYKDVHYIEKNGFEDYYTIDNTPLKLNKKIKLLKYFRQYMNDYLLKTGADILAKDVNQLSRPAHVYWWYRCNESVAMQLTNGTLQINFADHSKVILCPLMNAVTFIKNNAFRTYRFSTIGQYGCDPEFTKYLEYALSEIQSILRNGYL